MQIEPEEKSSSFTSSRTFAPYITTTMNGVIKKKTEKGFGFISAEGQSKDLFFHSNGLVGVTFTEIQEGDKVTFDVEDSTKGPSAVNVQRAA